MKPTLEFLNNAMRNYVTLCLNVGMVQATKIIVCKAVFQKISFTHRIDSISTDNISIFLHMAKLILQTGHEGHASLMTIVQYLWKYFPTCDIGWLPIPYTTNKLQTHIRNRSNQYSLISMLPIPFIIHKNLNQHAICSIKELLGYIVFFSSPKSHLNVKKRIK